MTQLKYKVFAYITNRNRLLVFDHVEHPDAGTQVPAGTRLLSEAPEDAVLREAHEETGLLDLRLVRFLGEVEHSRPDTGQLHHRRFYHLICDGEPPERWQHYERYPSDGGVEPILFECYWVDLPDGIPPLAPGHDEFVEALSESIEQVDRSSITP